MDTLVLATINPCAKFKIPNYSVRS